ncbi:phage tail protein [Nostoc sp. PCC 7524]|uniref:phage tail protein n=1 Tax=Nostoc sp. (strain ATCC 29411 / PCC 7524) TaxID=28072 RepID=UPI00029ED8FC|nr:phage tail protein [Nostoc sp. PCC 7524]AFY47146.1 phage tail protein [Nostoc sp. PCC 7524]
MNAKNSKSVSTYHQYLPAILQQDIFIGQFLLAFEKILSGLDESPSKEQIITANNQNIPGLEEIQNIPGLEEIIDNIHLYFNPQRTPKEFLPWLAGWVALSLRNDWQVEVKKAFIQKIVKLYRLRGTKQGLIEILKIYLQNSGFGENVEVFDHFEHFPHYFQVQLTLPDRDPDKYWRQAKIAKAIIDQEKPAQTFYTLKILVPTMQLTKRSHVAYPFKLFAPPQNQRFAIEIIITPNNSNSVPMSQLAKQLAIQMQGNLKLITYGSPEISIKNKSFSVKYNLDYQHFQRNLTGFYATLSNCTDKVFQGNLAINLEFYINDIKHTNTLLEQPINLSPVLKICSKNKRGEIIAGNTIFQQASQPEPSGMMLTKSIWTNPYIFQTFAAPKIQELQPKIIALIEKIELAAIVEITQPNSIDSDLLNKITVRLQDKVSDDHLLTPETTIDQNKITIKRTLYYQQFMQTIDQLAVSIKNLNPVDISGKVIVQVDLNINQLVSTYKLLENTFNLKAVPTHDILQICSKDEEDKIVAGNTILGTISQSI